MRVIVWVFVVFVILRCEEDMVGVVVFGKESGIRFKVKRI